MIDFSAEEIEKAYACYPTAPEVDAWAERLKAGCEREPVAGELLNFSPIRAEFGNNPNTIQNRYVRFTGRDGRAFYGYWQPALRTPAPLAVNLPGYGSFMGFHAQINDDGYHVLHISPLGYVTPEGPRRELVSDNGEWPVLPNTALGLPGGYEDWLGDALRAVQWARRQPGVLPDRVSFFGTSQGGGGSLLLASLLVGEGARCACGDVPFMAAYPLSRFRGSAYGLLEPVYRQVDHDQFWNRLGYVDLLSHVHRLQMPVMLTTGGRDEICPAETVACLFERLRGTKQLTYLQNGIHTHTREGMYLIRAWLAMYA
jgi:hypothetical protein